jgi:hypothetical protein
MNTTAVCGACGEDISWWCSKCYKMESTTHIHNYDGAVLGGQISTAA